MRVAIIGAGVTGLVSLKYCIDAGYECDAFELTEYLGGTWVYDENVGTDENGFPSYRTMYKGLKTNQPKELMTLPDYPYPSHIEESFITQPQVLQYLNDYAKVFNLGKQIQYFKNVTKVEPKLNSKWLVTVMDVKTKVETSKCYDSVFVCNGHFHHKNIPKITGQNVFKGLQMHSGDYRNPDLYKNKRVLLIGGSFSAIDIAGQISAVAAAIYLSHWTPVTENLRNTTVKSSVIQLTENGATFKDGTKQDVDIIMYCTGYLYYFPFLTKECGITVENNWVRPLYKHVINIEHPTMYFIGIPFLVTVFPVSDLQVRFAIAALEDKFVLPSKSEMLRELEDYMRKQKENNIPQRHTHGIGIEQGNYLVDLAKTAGIRPIPPVISRILSHRFNNRGKLGEVRRYILVNDYDFIEC